MADTYHKLTIYYDNGYSRIDVPTRAALKANSKRETRSIAMMNDNVSIKRTFNIEVSGDIAKQANFIEDNNAAGDFYYDVMSAAPLNSTTYNFSCEINPFLSDPKISAAGKLARITPEKNTTGNTAEEPFVPTYKAQQVILGTEGAYGAAFRSLVLSTVDLDTITEHGDLYDYTYDTAGNKILSVRKVDAGYATGAKDSTYEVNVFGGTVSRIPSPGVGIYTYDPKQIATLASWGLTDAIKSRWLVPTENVTITLDADNKHHVSTLAGISSMGENHLRDLYNNKKTTLYDATITVRANASGESKTFSAFDVYGNNYTEPKDNQRGVFNLYWWLWFDPSPNGRPYVTLALGRYDHDGSVGESKANWARSYTKGEGTVAGARWYHPDLTFEGVRSGSTIANYNTAVQLSTARLGAIAGVAGSAGDLASGIVSATTPAAGPDTYKNGQMTEAGGIQGTGVGSIGGGVGRAVSDFVQAGINGFRSGDFRSSEEILQENAINDIKNRNAAANTMYSPAYLPGSLDGVASYGDNGFTIYMSCLSYEDKQSLDRYLTEYGWASSEVRAMSFGGGVSPVDNGKNFTYIQYDSLSVSSQASSPIGEAELLKARLLSGVRIWKNGSPRTVGYGESNFN